MKILIVSQYFYPEQFRVNDICSSLVKKGHNVTVLTGLPNYPKGEIFDGYENKGNTEEIVFGARVIRCKLRPRYKGTRNLCLNYLSFVIEANKVIKRIDNDIDVIYVYGTSPITQALPAIKYKKCINKEAKILYYCCDLWPEAVRGAQNGHKAISKRHPVYLLAKSISCHIYKQIDLICSKCDEFNEYIQRECRIKKVKMATLFEHAESVYLNVKEKPIDNGIVDFFFLGNIGDAQRCDLIVDAASLLKETSRPFAIHFVGDGSYLKTLKDKVNFLQLNDKVFFHNKCDVEKVITYYDMADVCLLTLSNRTSTGLTPPAKLSSYMAACRPILASINGAAQTIIDSANCGKYVEADNVNGLAKLMQRFIDNQEELNEYGKNGRVFFLNNFTLEKHIDGLEKWLEELKYENLHN